jgi:hypothetical protein
MIVALQGCVIVVSILGVHIGGSYWGSILRVHIRVPNRGPKSGSQIGVPNRGPKSGSQIGVPNRGPKSGSQFESRIWLQVIPKEFPIENKNVVHKKGGT